MKLGALAALALLALSTPALADEATEPAPPKPAPPYSIPWGLRPVLAKTLVRVDTSLAFYEDRLARNGFTSATMITGAYRIPGTGAGTSGLAPLVRVAIVADAPPTGQSGLALVNPLLGATYSLDLGEGFRLAPFLGLTLPIGMGGGEAPAAGPLDARSKGANARAQLDNALFAVNDLTVIPGIGVAWVDHGWTVQVEATLLHLMRTRGDAVQREAKKTNFTTGLHVGWFAARFLSLGGELRYQRWLNAPLVVERDTTDASRDAFTLAFGPRLHLDLGSIGWLRPGVAYARGLDKPLAASTPNYHLFQVDVPLLFR